MKKLSMHRHQNKNKAKLQDKLFSKTSKVQNYIWYAVIRKRKVRSYLYLYPSTF